MLFRFLEGLMIFYVLFLEIYCKFRKWMTFPSVKTWRSSSSNLWDYTLLLSSMKCGWPTFCQDLGTYLKTKEIVAFLEFDVDHSEDLSFSSIKVITSYEIPSTSISSTYLTFLSVTFQVKGIVLGRTSHIVLLPM